MFISLNDLFKIGIGPSSSHTMGPLFAALDFISSVQSSTDLSQKNLNINCTLKGSLAFTGKGHATDYAVTLGLHGYNPEQLTHTDVHKLVSRLWGKPFLGCAPIKFEPENDITFDFGKPLPQHPNSLIFTLFSSNKVIYSATYLSVGGGFIEKLGQKKSLEALNQHPYPFKNAQEMIQMSHKSQLNIAQMKYANETCYCPPKDLDHSLDRIWQTMKTCVENGINSQEKTLPGGLNLPRRAAKMHKTLLKESLNSSLNEWLCAYAMAVSEENAAGQMVVTAPTNGAAGVIPAVLYYLVKHKNISTQERDNFLLITAAIGGLIKFNSSISGAEVGCQGEIGSAAAMAAAGICFILGGRTEQIENAAEIALEHHLGMTCDPIKGLVQIPCIERNGFGAIKAYTAANLAIHGTGKHYVSLDQCIITMKQTGEEMSEKYKETSLGGLAVNITEC